MPSGKPRLRQYPLNRGGIVYYDAHAAAGDIVYCAGDRFAGRIDEADSILTGNL
jgi:hypothetical protein